jgi:hypothetical protein
MKGAENGAIGERPPVVEVGEAVMIDWFAERVWE